jgi:quinol monooxygenase YgiN
VFAFFKAKPGRGKQLEKILQTLVAPTRSEPGNIAYVLHRSTTSPDELFFDEMFVSVEAFEEHAQKPYIKSVMSKIGHLVDAPLRV